MEQDRIFGHVLVRSAKGGVSVVSNVLLAVEANSKKPGDQLARRRIARIARLLDAHQLTQRSEVRWVDRINIDSIKMSDPKACLLAQLYGSWHVGLRELQIAERETVYYGLVASDPVTWTQLTEALRAEVVPRMR